MKVKIVYDDSTSLTAQEIIQNTKHMFGDSAEVEITPVNNSPESYIYFGIQSLITEEQINYFFEFGPHLYPEKVEELKERTLERIENILDKVLADNEKKVT